MPRFDVKVRDAARCRSVIVTVDAESVAVARVRGREVGDYVLRNYDRFANDGRGTRLVDMHVH